MPSTQQMILVINDFGWIVWVYIFLILLMNRTGELVGTQDMTLLKQHNSLTEGFVTLNQAFNADEAFLGTLGWIVTLDCF